MDLDLPLEFTEVVLEAEPVLQMETTKVFLRSSNDDVAEGQCPESHPYAFAKGTKCCKGNMENHPKSGKTGWELLGSRGLLHFDSEACFYPFVSCDQELCLNFEYRKYPCYMEDVDITTETNLGYIPTATPEDCERMALNVSAAAFVWTKLDQICYPKNGHVHIVPGKMNAKTWAGILHCL